MSEQAAERIDDEVEERASVEDAPPASADAEVPAERRDVDIGLEFRQRRADLLRGTLEHRDFEVEGMECRALDDGTIRMTGIASVTEHFYDVGDPKRGGFRERISRNAFKRSLGEQPDVVLLGNHDGWPLARTKNSSLALQETPRGLQWDADLDAEDPESKMISRKVEKGLVDQCSFAFMATDDAWNEDYTERTIKCVSLHRGDVSIVTFGANEATSVATMRSADGAVELRAGKAISAANQAQLQRVLDLVADADDAVDEAQPLLADLLGVPNPDDDESSETSPDDETAERSAVPEEVAAVVPLPDHTTRARERLARLRRSA